MVRRKGERTDKHRNRTHPFQVELPCPGYEPGLDMHAMMRWCALHDHETTRAGLNFMRWCFMSADKADAFQAEFGGTRLDQPIDPSSFKPERPPGPRELARRQAMTRIGMEIIEAARTDPAGFADAPGNIATK